MFLILNAIYPPKISRADDIRVEFSLSRNRVDSKGEITLNMVTDDPDYTKNLYVKPVTLDAGIGIFDAATSSWVTQYSVWERMPKAAEQMKLRLTGFETPTAEIWLEIKDATNGKVYGTSEAVIYNKNTIYVQALNETLTKYKESAEHKGVTSPPKDAVTNTSPPDMENEKEHLPAALTVFGLSCAAGFKKSARQMVKLQHG